MPARGSDDVSPTGRIGVGDDQPLSRGYVPGQRRGRPDMQLPKRQPKRKSRKGLTRGKPSDQVPRQKGREDGEPTGESEPRVSEAPPTPRMSQDESRADKKIDTEDPLGKPEPMGRWEKMIARLMDSG